MAELSTDVQYIKGIGPQRAKALQKVGVTTLEDLVSYFPRSYEDRREVCTIAQLQPCLFYTSAPPLPPPSTRPPRRRGGHS